MKDLSAIETWADCHRVFSRYGLFLKAHDNGLIIQDMKNSKRSIKTSDLDRGLGKSKLEKRLGAFEIQTKNADKDVTLKFTYTAQSRPGQQKRPGRSALTQGVSIVWIPF